MTKKKDRVVIITDTREQDPYIFATAQSERGTLKTGDYSIKGYEHLVGIERKSLPDFIKTVTWDHEKRWRPQLKRLRKLQWGLVVVEASWSDLTEERYPGKAHPQALIGNALQALVKYGVHVHFLENRILAQRWTEGILIRIHKEILSQERMFSDDLPRKRKKKASSSSIKTTKGK